MAKAVDCNLQRRSNGNVHFSTSRILRWKLYLPQNEPKNVQCLIEKKEAKRQRCWKKETLVLVVRLIKFIRLPMDVTNADDDDIAHRWSNRFRIIITWGCILKKQKCNFSIKYINASSHTHRFHPILWFYEPKTVNTEHAMRTFFVVVVVAKHQLLYDRAKQFGLDDFFFFFFFSVCYLWKEKGEKEL